ncbi:hypothetical protein HALLA_13390 [Halostagnicola larsenii XH-48]|uniref:Uncharacterized protein n=1 Tax=Halostagnicola larsenii XH-48 TaxID=797299 RepID=W0JQZ4_9EURY|nr:hypothetical protein HALLA_13390 [Halostagnicola larsenii XH-48]
MLQHIINYYNIKSLVNFCWLKNLVYDIQTTFSCYISTYIARFKSDICVIFFLK